MNTTEAANRIDPNRYPIEVVSHVSLFVRFKGRFYDCLPETTLLAVVYAGFEVSEFFEVVREYPDGWYFVNHKNKRGGFLSNNWDDTVRSLEMRGLVIKRFEKEFLTEEEMLRYIKENCE